MKEIRLHGRGGQGVVKSAQTIVRSVVESGAYAHFIPFFGVERKGSPVYGYLRIDDMEIREKCQVYEPEVLIVLDDTLLDMPQTFAGLKDGGAVILNTVKPLKSLEFPSNAGTIALVNATGIALNQLGRSIPNTAMLGAFAKVTGLLDWENLKEHIGKTFGEQNILAAEEAYEKVDIFIAASKEVAI